MISIIGPTYAGKDTVADRLDKQWGDRCIVFRSGVECRAKFGEDFMLKCSNPNAPDEVEGFVRSRYGQLYGDAVREGKTFISTSAPRSPSQVAWFLDLIECHNDVAMVLSLQIGDGDQIKRMLKRDGSDPSKLKFGRARIEGGRDRKQVEEVLKLIQDVPRVTVIEARS